MCAKSNEDNKTNKEVNNNNNNNEIQAIKTNCQNRGLIVIGKYKQ